MMFLNLILLPLLMPVDPHCNLHHPGPRAQECHRQLLAIATSSTSAIYESQKFTKLLSADHCCRSLQEIRKLSGPVSSNRFCLGSDP